MYASGIKTSCGLKRKLIPNPLNYFSIFILIIYQNIKFFLDIRFLNYKIVCLWDNGISIKKLYDTFIKYININNMALFIILYNYLGAVAATMTYR